VLVGVIGFSYLLQPNAWQAWARFLTRSSSGSWGGVGLLIVRCLIATTLVVVAARMEKAMLMRVALIIANPIPGWMALTMLAAIPRLLKEGAIDRPAAEGGPEAVDGATGRE
jgi:hypothetical protein